MLDRGSQRGFSVLELLVAMAITAILSFVALPKLATLSESFNRVNAKSYLLQDIKRAQAETITQGCRGIIVVSAGGDSYSFGCDYLAYDASASPQPDKVFFVRNLPNKVTLSTSGNIILNSRGQTVDKDFILSSVTLTLWERQSGTPVSFASGVLTGSGIFSY